jgi:hypothetical protein
MATKIPSRLEMATYHQLLLAHVGISLEPTEAGSSGGQELASMQASFPLGSVEPKSSVVESTPKLHELCGDSSMVFEPLELSGGVAIPPCICRGSEVGLARHLDHDFSTESDAGLREG